MNGQRKKNCMKKETCSRKGCDRPVHLYVLDEGVKKPLCRIHYYESLRKLGTKTVSTEKKTGEKPSNYSFDRVLKIPVDELVASDWNPNSMNPIIRNGKVVFDPKQSLLEDMKTHGPEGIAPVEVFPHGNICMVFDGNHRWMLARKLGWRWMYAIVRGIDEAEAKGLSYRRNRERGSLDPLKEADLFESEWKSGLTHEQIAKKYNVSRQYVTDRIGIKKIEKIAPRGAISASGLEVLARAKPKTQEKIVKKIKKGELLPTVKAIDEEVKREEFNIEEMKDLAKSIILNEVVFSAKEADMVRWLQKKWGLNEEDAVRKAVAYAYEKLRKEA